MKILSGIAALLVFGFLGQAEAAKGIVAKKPGSGNSGKIMTYTDGTSQVYFFELSKVGDDGTKTPQVGDLVSFEPRGRHADSVELLPPDGYIRYAIEGTPKTPTIFFDSKHGFLEIKGRSIPENSIEFYKPLAAALEKYIQKPAPGTLVTIRLKSMNEDSQQELLNIFKKLEGIHKGGSSMAKINWHYEEDDEDMLEAGEDYQAIINIPFNILEVSHEDWNSR